MLQLHIRHTELAEAMDLSPTITGAGRALPKIEMHVAANQTAAGACGAATPLQMHSYHHAHKFASPCNKYCL